MLWDLQLTACITYLAEHASGGVGTVRGRTRPSEARARVHACLTPSTLIHKEKKRKLQHPHEGGVD